jgi:transposase-like protein
MPWSQTTPMDQKTQFIADYLRKRLSITELCELYGISRKTGYKFIDRYLRVGPQGLEELSRRPTTCPNRTPEYIEQAIVAARQRHPSWSAKKQYCARAIGVGFSQHALPSVTFSVAMGLYPNDRGDGTSVIRESPSAKPYPLTMCGVPTLKDSLKPAMDDTVTRLP